MFVLDKVIEESFIARHFVSWTAGGYVWVDFCFVGDGCVGERRGEFVVRAGVPLVRAGVDWITSWLPVFFVPSLVTLPLVVSTMEAATLGKIIGLLVVGFSGDVRV